MEHTPQIRHWCFTWYENRWPAWIPDKMIYLVYQVEQCPDTGRPHIQGYVEFKRSVRLGSAKKLIGSNTAHLEPRQGSRDQARAYCMKDESRVDGPYEQGEWLSGADKRSELQEAITKIKEKVDWSIIVEDFTGVAVRYWKSLKLTWAHFNLPARDGTTPVYNLYIYGDAGVGKTRFSHWLASRFNQVPYTGYIRNWWEDYVGQQWALYDDFDGAVDMAPGAFKKICDRYSVTVQCKGGSAQYRASVNIFTSNLPPIEWYERVHWDAIKRRGCHQIYWRTGDIFSCEAPGCKVGESGECELIEHIRLYLADIVNDEVFE